jgi:hypothetical protein
MPAHQYGQAPGSVAPEPTTSIRPTTRVLIDPHALPSPEWAAPKDTALAAKAAQSREQVEHVDSAPDDGAGKAFATLRAELALIGYCLSPATWGGYRITRWNLQRDEGSLEGVRQFLRRVKP